MGRLVKDPTVRYTQGAKPLAVARYTLAVNRRFKRKGEKDADFIECVAFGKIGEFAEKYLKKGQMISVIGRLQTTNFTDKEGKRRFNTNVIIEEHYFAASKAGSHKTSNTNTPNKERAEDDNEFYSIDISIEDDDLPF